MWDGTKFDKNNKFENFFLSIDKNNKVENLYGDLWSFSKPINISPPPT